VFSRYLLPPAMERSKRSLKWGKQEQGKQGHVSGGFLSDCFRIGRGEKKEERTKKKKKMIHFVEGESVCPTLINPA